MAILSTMHSGCLAGPEGYFGPETYLIKCEGGFPKCHKWKFKKHKFCPACRHAYAFRERPLTNRQKTVIGLYAGGMTVKEIAYELKVSPKTIEFHIAVSRTKLKVKTSIFLVHYALQNNLVPNHFATWLLSQTQYDVLSLRTERINYASWRPNVDLRILRKTTLSDSTRVW